jgi:cyclopropane-fatty-acyl-phospholipid synthase
MLDRALELAERGRLPLPALRWGIRRMLRERLRDERGRRRDLTPELTGGPVALASEQANAQHYELPPAFFELVLGPRLKYSGAYWPPGVDSLAAAEEAMLELYVERARLADGQRILELGCGWGSLCLALARRFPRARILAVSNSAPQRRFIAARAPANLTVITADMNTFATAGRFDRVVSIEMFEHMRNYRELHRRIAGWLEPGGALFVHVFCHRRYAYPFETSGPGDWMGRYFFTGGLMPAFDLLARFQDDVRLEERWDVRGDHYARTARAWRENLERHRADALPVLAAVYGPADAARWYQRWRLFFLACEELFGYRRGTEWMVGHYRFARP